MTFSSPDFWLIRVVHKEVYDKRYCKLKRSGEAFESKTITDKEYQGMRSEFLLWLATVKTQLECFTEY